MKDSSDEKMQIWQTQEYIFGFYQFQTLPFSEETRNGNAALGMISHNTVTRPNDPGPPLFRQCKQTQKQQCREREEKISTNTNFDDDQKHC